MFPPVAFAKTLDRLGLHLSDSRIVLCLNEPPVPATSTADTVPVEGQFFVRTAYVAHLVLVIVTPIAHFPLAL